jgi:hypothetical protein
MSHRFWAFVTLICATACADADKDKKDDKQENTCDAPNLLCSVPPPDGEDPDEQDKGDGPGPASPTFAFYDREKHAIIAYFEYGGCVSTKHHLGLDECAESYPMQCPAKVTRDPFDDSCDMFIYQEETFELTESLDDAVVKLSDEVSVTVDKDGNLGAANTYKISGVVTKFPDEKCGPKYYLSAEGDDTFLLFDAELPVWIAVDKKEATVVVTDREFTDEEKANCEVGGAGMIGVHLEYAQRD